MIKSYSNISKTWLAFELNILRRLKFKSIAIPNAQNPKLGFYLKHWNVRVMTTDLLRSDHAKAVAQIQNNSETLLKEEVDAVLEDAYVPGYELKNKALANWFSETDAWWFDNVRQNIAKLASPNSRAVALSVGMDVGDYALSFDENTREFRQPLSNVFKKLLSLYPEPVNNAQNNSCQNKDTNEFIAEVYPDLLFLKLPQAHNQNIKDSLGWEAWREEWARGTYTVWKELEAAQTGKFGARVETKQQYLSLLEEVFRAASHIPLWAVEHSAGGFIQTQDIVETIGKVRRVDTIYTKDFTELMGTKAVIITA